MPTRKGAIRIFRLFGIDVYLSWWWIAFAFIRIQFLRYRHYDSPVWYGIEYLTLFAIVLTHEFGHALACKQVGGQANLIVLWPLGGVAYVSPPQRPGAMLWSIAAGPLVNVALVPVFSVFWYCSHLLGWAETLPDVYQFLRTIWQINLGLLVFNMLPVFPLDGGQILRSLLWFPFGRGNSLLIVSIIGFFGVVGGALFALLAYLGGETFTAAWLGVIDFFVAMNCWRGIQQARGLLRLEKAPRRNEFHCPVCRESPPIGELWRCGRCQTPFDTFLTQGFCPSCNAEYAMTACPYCFNSRPMAEWRGFQAPTV